MARLGVVISISEQSVRNAICDLIRECKNVELIGVDREPEKDEGDEEFEVIRMIRKFLKGKGRRRVIVIVSLPAATLIEATIPRWFSEFYGDDLVVVGISFSPPPVSVWSFQSVVGVRSVGGLEEGLQTAIQEALCGISH